MQRATPIWKIFLALLSLLLVAAVWTKGLQDSFNRPSVTPALSLKQQEMALVAEPAVPIQLKAVLVGANPADTLRKSLLDIPFEEMRDRERLLLAALDPSWIDRQKALSETLAETSLLPFQKSLSQSQKGQVISVDPFYEKDTFIDEPLLKRFGCLALGGDEDKCIDSKLAGTMAFKLAFSQALPACGLLVGTVLLLRQIWLIFRKATLPWPELISSPLSITDMVLLVGGGFVVLGEVIVPTFAVPLGTSLLSDLKSPLSQAVTVLIGYCSMTVPPLIILRQQLQGLDGVPRDGWLQWRLHPLSSAISKAFQGWLMVLPAVLLISWLMTLLFGDQGGSNPLLELVLSSRDSFALMLLLLTTVVLAPVFEEVVFRGVLLPVLAKSLGQFWGVITSALVFGLAHLSVGELTPLFVLGIGLALLRLSTGRLLPCVLMHAFWNGITFTNLLLLGGS